MYMLVYVCEDGEYICSGSGMRMTTGGRRSKQSIYIYEAREHVMEGPRTIVEWNDTITHPHQEWSHVGMRPRERQCFEKRGKGSGLVRILAVMSSVGIYVI